MFNYDSSPTLSNIKICKNAAASFGGGMFNYTSAASPTMTNMTICNNSANVGGGVYNRAASPILTNVTISHNTATLAGGGMYNNDSNSSPILTNVIISHNTAAVGGGGIHTSGIPILTNVAIVDNAAYQGGGIYNYFSSPILTNVTISGNSATSTGGGIYFRNTPVTYTSTLNNCIIRNNTANDSGNEFLIGSGITLLLNYSCYENESGDIDNLGTLTPDEHCITSDPRFVDPLNGDYRLYGSSPCVDAGNNSFNSEIYDIRGFDFGRKLLRTNSAQSGTIDMGAYEYKSGYDPESITFTWTGNVSFDWNTIGNWDINNLIPNDFDNVIVPDTASTTYELIIADTINCNILTVQTDGIITIDEIGKLTVDSIHNADEASGKGVLLLWNTTHHGILMANGASYGQLPTVITSGTSDMTSYSKSLTGNVTSAGFYSAPMRGFVYSLNDPTPVIGEPEVFSDTNINLGTGLFCDTISGLITDTFYYYRAYAVNGEGISYSETDTFKTKRTCGQGFNVSDIDGNEYETVYIGSHCWTKQNLKSTHYANGDSVKIAKGYYTKDYPNIEENIAKFGRLYSWYSAVAVAENSTDMPATDSNLHVQGICPDGWFLPDQEIFRELIAYGGDALRSDTLWLSDLNGTNATDFNAFPGGFYNASTGEYYYLFGNAYFWSSASEDNYTANYVELNCHCSEILFNAKNKANGYSIRCVQKE